MNAKTKLYSSSVFSDSKGKTQDYNGLKNSSDKSKKNGNGTFWTVCPYCYYLYEYDGVYEDCCLRCQNCRRAFQGVAVPPPPAGMVVEGKEQYYCGVGYFPLTYDFESFLGGKKEESGGGDSCMGGKKEESGGGDSCMGEKKGSDEGFKKVMEDVVVISDDSDDDSENQKMREDENEENSAEFGEGAAETDPESEEKKIFGSLEDIVFLGDDFKNDT
ncbi:hypothetical protein P3X46_012731 [Hevea brasiliensis]|uniref:Zinc beta-ribbon domain-containing protein n=1 Tax=Hevea brasiliensis TaxID=3981 RepID=A0ABQ9MEW5_HEVBR|nr:hypothetical protein P3X46_012731 [Hevea brasiliensis]